jgi:hypothetical protein
MKQMQSRRRLFGAVIAAGVIVAIAAVLFGSTNNDRSHQASIAATPTTSAATDRADIIAVVAEFARAMEAGDGDGLYAIQSEVYRQGCSRADFEVVVASVKGQKITGVKGVQVKCDQAVATVTQRQPNGSEVSQLLPLQREQDGTWKLAAPAEGRCMP